MINPNERLIEAAKSGNLVELRAALDAGAIVDNKIDGNTALLWASAYGYLEIVKELINRGADKNIQDVEGFTPLSWASSLGRINVVSELVSRGVDITIKNKFGQSAYDLSATEQIKNILLYARAAAPAAGGSIYQHKLQKYVNKLNKII